MSDTERLPRRSETFCILPWIHLFADESSMMSPCCMTLETRCKNADAKGRPYYLKELTDVDEAWNSALMTHMRRTMLAGGRPRPCRRCFQHEDLGIRSYRQSVNETFQHHIEEAISGTDEEGRASPRIRSADIRLGNLCNLRCRMCSPTSSKALTDELQQISGWRSDHPYLVEARERNWQKSPEFWDFLERHLSAVEYLHFGGGESFLVKEMFDFLERIVAKGMAPAITLSYITNLTVLPPRIRVLWPRFKQVKLCLSLDGYGDLNSFIRYPSRWDSVASNLAILDADFDELNVSSATINTTVQAYNIQRLDELFDFTLTNLRRVKPCPNLALLNYPASFSIQILPPELKRRAERRLRDWVAAREGRWPSELDEVDRRNFLNNLEGVIEHMMAVDRQDQIEEFIRRNDVYDSHRGQSLREVIPELAPLYDTVARRAVGG